MILFAALSLAACEKDPIKGDLTAAWRVEKLNGAAVQKFKATCTINIANGTAQGTNGCNDYGLYLRADESTQTISFFALVQTEKGCKDELGFFEIDYFEAIQKVSSYEFTDFNTLHLQYEDGKVIELKK
jgi:heat shock protein HslJ